MMWFVAGSIAALALGMVCMIADVARTRSPNPRRFPYAYGFRNVYEYQRWRTEQERFYRLAHPKPPPYNHEGE